MGPELEGERPAAADFDKLAQDAYNKQAREKGWKRRFDDLSPSTRLKYYYQAQKRYEKETGKPAYTQVKGDTSFKDYFESQPESFKRHWLGPTRYELYQQGKYDPLTLGNPDTGYVVPVEKLAPPEPEEKKPEPEKNQAPEPTPTANTQEEADKEVELLLSHYDETGDWPVVRDTQSKDSKSSRQDKIAWDKIHDDIDWAVVVIKNAKPNGLDDDDLQRLNKAYSHEPLLIELALDGNPKAEYYLSKIEEIKDAEKKIRNGQAGEVVSIVRDHSEIAGSKNEVKELDIDNSYDNWWVYVYEKIKAAEFQIELLKEGNIADFDRSVLEECYELEAGIKDKITPEGEKKLITIDGNILDR